MVKIFIEVNCLKEILDFSFHESDLNHLNYKKHFHVNYYEILLILQGSGSFFVKNRLYEIKASTICLINGVGEHCFYPKQDCNYLRSRVVISKNYIDSLARLTNCSNMINDLFLNERGCCCIELDDRLTEMIDLEFSKTRHSLLQNDIYSGINATASIFKILTYAHANKSSAAHQIKNKVSEILLYIDQNLDQKISLDTLSQIIHCNKYYLCHLFKENTNMTISSYILSRRLSLSKKLLAQTDNTISEIAMKCGFESFSYFSKLFHDNTGLTPSQFRKKHKLKNTAQIYKDI